MPQGFEVLAFDFKSIVLKTIEMFLNRINLAVTFLLQDFTSTYPLFLNYLSF